MYDCADYRRHAEIGGHYSVNLTTYRPRRNCHLLTRRFARALGLAVSLSVITAFAGVYLSFYLDSAPAPTIVVLFAIVFIAAFIYATWRDRRNEIVPEAQG